MTIDEFEKRIKAITADTDFSDIHTSPDFQCDQTGGFPTSLCACFEKRKAWLELNENLFMDRDEMELDYSGFGTALTQDNSTHCCKISVKTLITAHISRKKMSPLKWAECNLAEFANSSKI